MGEEFSVAARGQQLLPMATLMELMPEECESGVAYCRSGCNGITLVAHGAAQVLLQATDAPALPVWRAAVPEAEKKASPKKRPASEAVEESPKKKAAKPSRQGTFRIPHS